MRPVGSLLFALVLGIPSPAVALSFMGCDKAAHQVPAGNPHQGWRICKTRLLIADVRGQGAERAAKVAVSGSHKYVILKTQGSRPDILRRAEQALRSLAADGYVAVGLVLGDGGSPTVMEVFSGGRPDSYDVLRNVDAHDGELGIRKVVIEAYERDIGPRKR